MKRYPLLRQATEELLTQYLREREIITKHACTAYVQTQLAYINTNNEDFIGFAGFVRFPFFSHRGFIVLVVFSAEKSVTSGETKRHVTNQVNSFPSPVSFFFFFCSCPNPHYIACSRDKYVERSRSILSKCCHALIKSP